MNSYIKKLFIFDDIAGDKKFSDITRTFLVKDDRIIVNQFILLTIF